MTDKQNGFFLLSQEIRLKLCWSQYNILFYLINKNDYYESIYIDGPCPAGIVTEM